MISTETAADARRSRIQISNRGHSTEIGDRKNDEEVDEYGHGVVVQSKGLLGRHHFHVQCVNFGAVDRRLVVIVVQRFVLAYSNIACASSFVMMLEHSQEIERRREVVAVCVLSRLVEHSFNNRLHADLNEIEIFECFQSSDALRLEQCRSRVHVTINVLLRYRTLHEAHQLFG